MQSLRERSTAGPRGLFVTGTDTGVGKTYVAALIARQVRAGGVRVGVYKPVASGCARSTDGTLFSEDAAQLWEAAGRPGELLRVSPQRFAAPIAPHLAARAEGRLVDRKLLREGVQYWRDRSEFVLVEGAGGLMSPISDDDYNADLAAEFGYPLLVVAANALGAINQTLQTLITAASCGEGLPVAGIVLNDVRPRSGDDPSTASNRAELDLRAVSPVVVSVAHSGSFDRTVNWQALASGS
jgi:dethiobiotin synthetase